MDKKKMKQMAKMVDAVQPHCNEEIVAAMTCSHAGSMSSFLVSKLTGIGGMVQSSDLPNPVFIAVGANTIYAFDYAPKGFNFKIKKEVARWPKNDISVLAEKSKMMVTFVLTTGSGESYPFEVATMMGGKELVDMFLDALGASLE